MRYEIELFIKVEYLVKTFKKYVLKKIECLANTYKSGDLSGKLLKMTKYIYICKDTDCSPHLDGNRGWAQQAQYNKFVREWVEEFGW